MCPHQQIEAIVNNVCEIFSTHQQCQLCSTGMFESLDQWLMAMMFSLRKKSYRFIEAAWMTRLKPLSHSAKVNDLRVASVPNLYEYYRVS